MRSRVEGDVEMTALQSLELKVIKSIVSIQQLKQTSHLKNTNYQNWCEKNATSEESYIY